MQQEFLLTRSSYYNQYFNTAIFFEPFRIYFNTSFESGALELYYQVQNYFKEHPLPKTNIYILMYGEESLFEESFGKTSDTVVVAKEEGDYVVGIRSTTSLEDYSALIKAIEGIS